MKTIWFISHHAMPPHMAVRTRTNNFAKQLAKKGYNVEIFSASTIHNTDINLIEDKRILYLQKEYDNVRYNHIRTSNYSGNGFSRIVNLLQFPIRLYKVAKRTKNKPDIVICNPQSIFAVIPYLISRKYKAKYISEVRDLWPESIVVYKDISKKNPIIMIMYLFEKWIYKKADKVIFSMEGGKDYIKDKGWDNEIDMTKIFHINNGVDLDLFHFNRLNNICYDSDLLDTKTFKVVYAGSIRVANNVKKIVDAAQVVNKKGNNNIKFLIYGDGNDKEYLEKYCNENNINNVVFKGFIEKNKIPYILSKCDLNILHFEPNSLKKYGASLNKLFEYFASGRPTVSDCEFGYDLIKRYRCGTVVDNADSDNLAEEIISFYNMSSEEYNSYCLNAKKAAKTFDYKTLTNKLERLLD